MSLVPFRQPLPQYSLSFHILNLKRQLKLRPHQCQLHVQVNRCKGAILMKLQMFKVRENVKIKLNQLIQCILIVEYIKRFT